MNGTHTRGGGSPFHKRRIYRECAVCVRQLQHTQVCVWSLVFIYLSVISGVNILYNSLVSVGLSAWYLTILATCLIILGAIDNE